MKTLRQQIQRAIQESGRSRNSIAVEAGLDPAQLHRLAHGQSGASLDVIEKVAEVLGYQVVLMPRKSAEIKGR